MHLNPLSYLTWFRETKHFWNLNIFFSIYFSCASFVFKIRLTEPGQKNEESDQKEEKRVQMDNP